MILSVALFIMIIDPFMPVYVQKTLTYSSELLLAISALPVYFFIRRSSYSHTYNRLTYIRKILFRPIIVVLIILLIYIEDYRSDSIERSLLSHNIDYEINVVDLELIYDRKIKAYITKEQLSELLAELNVSDFDYKNGYRKGTLRYLYNIQYKEGTLIVEISLRMPK